MPGFGIRKANTRRQSRELSLPKQFVCAEKGGVFLAEWQNLVRVAIVAALPATVIAQGTDRAILHNTGGTLLNKNPAPESQAIFPNDLIETQMGHIATIDADGSSVFVQPETVVQFDADQLNLDHGFLQVTTSRELKVRVNCLTVTPISADRTQYDVIDVDGKVKVIAYKNDVKVHSKGSAIRRAERGGKQDGSGDDIVRAGQQKTRDEHCGSAVKPTDGVAANGAIFNSTWAKGGGLAGIGILCLFYCDWDDPISPATPRGH